MVCGHTPTVWRCHQAVGKTNAAFRLRFGPLLAVNLTAGFAQEHTPLANDAKHALAIDGLKRPRFEGLYKAPLRSSERTEAVYVRAAKTITETCVARAWTEKHGLRTRLWG